MKLKIHLVIWVMYTCFHNDIFAQEKITPKQNIASVESQESKDWNHLNYMKNFFCKAPEGCEQYDSSNMLEGMLYVDRLYTTRSKLAEAFLDKYPNSPHYEKALTLFFSIQFSPQFISREITDDQVMAISSLPRRGLPGAWSKAYRLLPVDRESEKRWLDKGNEIVANILASNASADRKAKAEISLFNRDYDLARGMYKYLTKDSSERDFFATFERYYFASFPIRLEMLMDTYPDSERLAKYIQAVVDDIRSLSPELAKNYTDRFFVKSGNSNPLANRIGIMALHKSLSDNIKALEELEINVGKPLDMSFTAIDGSKIDLAEMRGKVVLIDFWSTSCPPCITAMPHLKALYDKYRKKGFEIVGIAANGDGAKNQVLKILKKVNADWPQYLDKGNGATVSYHSLFQIAVLPTVWLLDKEGKIVDKNARGKRLEPLIQQYLGLNDQ